MVEHGATISSVARTLEHVTSCYTPYPLYVDHVDIQSAWLGAYLVSCMAIRKDVWNTLNAMEHPTPIMEEVCLAATASSTVSLDVTVLVFCMYVS